MAPKRKSNDLRRRATRAAANASPSTPSSSRVSKRSPKKRTPSPPGTPPRTRKSPGTTGGLSTTRSGRAYAPPLTPRPTDMAEIWEDINTGFAKRLLSDRRSQLEIQAIAAAVVKTIEERKMLQGHGSFLRQLVGVFVALAVNGLVSGTNAVAARAPEEWNVEFQALRLAYVELYPQRGVLEECLAERGLEGLVEELPVPEDKDGDEMDVEEIGRKLVVEDAKGVRSEKTFEFAKRMFEGKGSGLKIGEGVAEEEDIVESIEEGMGSVSVSEDEGEVGGEAELRRSKRSREPRSRFDFS